MLRFKNNMVDSEASALKPTRRDDRGHETL
jgi:hypothetical protein